MRKTKQQVGPQYQPITSEYLDYDEVIAKYDKMMDWLAHLYVGTLNMIHYMHDKYYYEAAEMALIDTKVERSFATGIAGFSHVVDSLSAIKYAKVKAIRDEEVLQQISRLRVTSHVMVMMMTEQTRLQQLFCLHSLRN